MEGEKKNAEITAVVVLCRVDFFAKLPCQPCHIDFMSNFLCQSIMVWYCTVPKFYGIVLVMDTITTVLPYHTENIIYKLYNIELY